MTHEEIELAVIKGVKTALRDLGIDAGEWKDVRKDMDFLRRTRLRCESAVNRVYVAAMALFLGGGMLSVWRDIIDSVAKALTK